MVENVNNQTYQPAPYSLQPPVYPTYPANPNIWTIAPAFQLGAQAIQAERDRANAEIENIRLRDRLAQRTLAEQAYTLVGATSGRTFTVGKNGQLIELMNQEIEQAWHFYLLPPFSKGSYYIIRLRGIDQEIELDSQQFHRDTALIQAFQELPGVEIRPCRSVKLTAALLRQAICQHIQAVEQPFFAGWRPNEAGGFNFWTFEDGGASHIREAGMNSPISLGSAMSASVMTAAVQRFAQELGLNLAQPQQWLLWATFHVAALTSLLQQLEHSFLLSLCVLVENAAAQSWLTSFFQRFRDRPLSLTLPPADFSAGLLCRKDQAIIILDERRGSYADKNAELLEGVLASHLLPYKDRREEKFMPLQALPVILSTSASALTVSPDCVTLELPPEFSCPGSKISEAVASDYLLAFAQYTAAHVNRLRQLLDTMEDRTFECLEDCAWTEQHVQAVGIILAIDCFVREFHGFCGLNVQPLSQVCPDAEAWLVELVGQTADKMLDCGDLAAQFISVARSMLEDEALCPCPVEYEKEPDGNAVYYDEGSIGFTTSAMTTICQQLGQSRPVVLRALVQADLLQGRPVNSGTLLTRISTWNAYGVRKTRRVYKLPRAAFDTLGEPLTFEGEEIE